MARNENVPDDWDNHWHKCERCGDKYHGSEGGCRCEDDELEYWGEIPPIEDLDLEIEKAEQDKAAEDHFDNLERQREKGRP